MIDFDATMREDGDPGIPCEFDGVVVRFNAELNPDRLWLKRNRLTDDLREIGRFPKHRYGIDSLGNIGQGRVRRPAKYRQRGGIYRKYPISCVLQVPSDIMTVLVDVFGNPDDGD